MTDAKDLLTYPIISTGGTGHPYRRSHLWDFSLDSLLIRKISNGCTRKQLSIITGFSIPVINVQIRRLGLSRYYTQWKTSWDKELVAMWTTGIVKKDIADFFGCNETTIVDNVKRLDLELRQKPLSSEGYYG